MPPAALDEPRALLQPLLPDEALQHRPRRVAADRVGRQRGQQPAGEHERERDPEAVDEPGRGVDELRGERDDRVDEHQGDQHERPGRPEIPQLLPQLARIAAQHVPDRVAQRRHHQHERAEGAQAQQGEERCLCGPSDPCSEGRRRTSAFPDRRVIRHQLALRAVAREAHDDDPAGLGGRDHALAERGVDDVVAEAEDGAGGVRLRLGGGRRGVGPGGDAARAPSRRRPPSCPPGRSARAGPRR